MSGDQLALIFDTGLITVRLSELTPRLRDASPEQKSHVQLSPSGHGLHWPLLDEDLSIAGILRAHEERGSGPSDS